MFIEIALDNNNHNNLHTLRVKFNSFRCENMNKYIDNQNYDCS